MPGSDTHGLNQRGVARTSAAQVFEAQHLRCVLS
jgi:hypothetical protein